MTRFNALLFVATVLLALAVVQVQHRTRSAFVDLEQEKARQEQLEADGNQLQSEVGTLSSSHRIEDRAVSLLHMKVPDPGQKRLIILGVAPEISAP